MVKHRWCGCDLCSVRVRFSSSGRRSRVCLRQSLWLLGLDSFLVELSLFVWARWFGGVVPRGWRGCLSPGRLPASAALEFYGGRDVV